MQCNQGTPGGLFVHLSQSAPRVPPNYPQARHYHANLQPSIPCSRIFHRYFCTICNCISWKYLTCITYEGLTSATKSNFVVLQYVALQEFTNNKVRTIGADVSPNQPMARRQESPPGFVSRSQSMELFLKYQRWGGAWLVGIALIPDIVVDCWLSRK